MAHGVVSEVSRDEHHRYSSLSHPALLRVRSLNRFNRAKVSLLNSFSQGSLNGVRFSSKSVNPNALSFADLIRNKRGRHSNTYANMAEDIQLNNAMDPCSASNGPAPEGSSSASLSDCRRKQVVNPNAERHEAHGGVSKRNGSDYLSHPTDLSSQGSANYGLSRVGSGRSKEPVRSPGQSKLLVQGTPSRYMPNNNDTRQAYVADRSGGLEHQGAGNSNVASVSDVDNDANGLHSSEDVNTHRHILHVSEHGSPIQRDAIATANANAIYETFELIDDEEEEEGFIQEDIRMLLAHEAPRVRLIGNMTLREDPEAHELIMGYRRGDGPALMPFTSTSTTTTGGEASKIQLPNKQPWTPPTFPPRTTSLADCAKTPSTASVSISNANRLSRPTVASASHAVANSTHVIPSSGVATSFGSRIPRRTHTTVRCADFASLVASGHNDIAPASSPLFLGSSRVVSGSAIPTTSKTTAKTKIETLRRESAPAAMKPTLKSRVTSLMNIRKRHRVIVDDTTTEANVPIEDVKTNSRITAGTREYRVARDYPQGRRREHDVGYMGVAHSASNFERRDLNWRSRASRPNEDEDPHRRNNAAEGPSGHYTEVEEGATTIATGEDDSVVLADRFDEAGVGAFFDYQIAQARRQLRSVQECVRGLSDINKRDQLLGVVDNQFSFLNGLEHLRTANVHGNNATAALVRNLSESANSAAHTVIAAL